MKKRELFRSVIEQAPLCLLSFSVTSLILMTLLVSGFHVFEVGVSWVRMLTASIMTGSLLFIMYRMHVLYKKGRYETIKTVKVLFAVIMLPLLGASYLITNFISNISNEILVYNMAINDMDSMVTPIIKDYGSFILTMNTLGLSENDANSDGQMNNNSTSNNLIKSSDPKMEKEGEGPNDQLFVSGPTLMGWLKLEEISKGEQSAMFSLSRLTRDACSVYAALFYHYNEDFTILSDLGGQEIRGMSKITNVTVNGNTLEFTDGYKRLDVQGYCYQDNDEVENNSIAFTVKYENT